MKGKWSELYKATLYAIGCEFRGAAVSGRALKKVRQICHDGVEWEVWQMVLKHCKVGLTNFAMFERRSKLRG